jgi:hypothetical protein
MYFRKLPPQYGAIVMPLIMSMCMTCIVSAISVFRSQGLGTKALALWPSAWGLSWIVAFPVLVVILPWVRRLTFLIVRSA